MGDWSKFATAGESKEETTAFPTMNLRCVVGKSGQTIEQMVEYRNNKGMVVSTEWVAIPVVYQQEI